MSKVNGEPLDGNNEASDAKGRKKKVLLFHKKKKYFLISQLKLRRNNVDNLQKEKQET